jgi:uncharacterized membrane protein (DUF2068 family)
VLVREHRAKDAVVPAQYRRDREKSGVLLLIGIGKLLKGLLLVFAAVCTQRLAHSSNAAAMLLAWADHVHVDPDNHFVNRAMTRVLAIDEKKLQLISIGTWFYAALFLTEGVGLLLRQRWAEWLTVFVTGLFIPLEIYEITRHATAVRITVLVLNIAVVIYLVYRLKQQAAILRRVTGMSTLQRNRKRLSGALHRQ